MQRRAHDVKKRQCFSDSFVIVTERPPPLSQAVQEQPAHSAARKEGEDLCKKMAQKAARVKDRRGSGVNVPPGQGAASAGASPGVLDGKGGRGPGCVDTVAQKLCTAEFALSAPFISLNLVD